MLDRNAARVRNLSGWEIWLFILGRVLVALALGILAERYFAQIAEPLSLPILAVGVIFFLIAARGLLRKPAG